MAAHPDVLDNMHQGLKFIGALAAAGSTMALSVLCFRECRNTPVAALQRATRPLFMGTDEVNVAALVDNGTIDQYCRT